MCTGIQVTSKENNHYWGRTQEFNIPLPVQGIIVPRSSLVENTLTPIRAKYATAGISIDASEEGLDLVIMMDGVNEMGLAGGSFYFGAGYEESISSNDIKSLGKKPLRGEEFLTWALLTCKDTDDLVNRTKQEVAISNERTELATIHPQHYVFVDEKGKSVVIEPSIKGDFRIYRNPVGTFTNQPNFDWHLNNLNNYVHLTGQGHGNKFFGDYEARSPGNSSGLIGLPGDFTPQSRFVRATVLNKMSAQVHDGDAISKVFHVLNSFDIPKGLIHAAFDMPDELIPDELRDQQYSYTQYTSAYDIKEKMVHISTYENRTIQCFKLEDKYLNHDQIIRFRIKRKQHFESMEII